MDRLHGWFRVALTPLVLATLLSSAFLAPPARADRTQQLSLARCVAPISASPSVSAGHPYLAIAYAALTRDRAQYAGLNPLRKSTTLSAIAERHSAYMASIGSWSDGDPEGSILSRVHAAGLSATYAGQNVVTANGPTVAAALLNGEQFFAREANGGGPHWENITNPNHHYVGMGVALLGASGNYTIYLTQVFSDAGGCATTSGDTYSQAGASAPAIRIGSTAHPTVDALQLRTEPSGSVISTLHAADRLQVIDLRNGWAQVKVLATSTYGWVFAAFLARA